MEIKVANLQEAMELVRPVVPKKPKINYLNCVSLGAGKLTATDLETMVLVNVPEATEPMLLPYAVIADMLKFVPGYTLMKIEQRGKEVFLSWNGGEANYPTEDYADYPILPELVATAEGVIDGDILMKAMETALPYCAADEARVTLNGVTIVLGNPIEVCAGDGFPSIHPDAAGFIPAGGKGDHTDERAWR